MEKNKFQTFNGRVCGVKVSDYGLENGYLDYRALAGIVGDLILNNTIYGATGPEYWNLATGEDYNGEDDEYYDIYQFYIISDAGYRFLRDYTDELVYYNDEIDVYLWGITHFGTSWDYVLTDGELM